MSLIIFLAFAISYIQDEKNTDWTGKDIIIASHFHSGIENKGKKFKLDSKFIAPIFLQNIYYKPAFLIMPVIISSSPLVNLIYSTNLRL